MASYKPAIITFFDILGFKEIVKTSKCNEITEILDWLGYVAAADVEPGSNHSPQVVTFSDSVIRTQRIDNQTYRMGLLFQEILSILWAQMELSFRGILIRGAMTIGKVAGSPNRIFGPGFVEAYELESQIAQYPRVIVSSKALRMLDESNILIAQHHSRQIEKEYVKNLLRLDTDGVWFIDYLVKSESEVDDPSYYVELLSKHKDLITKNLKSTEIPPVDIHKYTWLAQYYNSTVDQLKDKALEPYGTSRRQLKVPVKALKPLYRF
jgi:hypothetical protein